MSERLTEQKVTERVDFLNRKVELVNQRFELAKATVTRVSVVKELNILTEEVR